MASSFQGRVTFTQNRNTGFLQIAVAKASDDFAFDASDGLAIARNLIGNAKAMKTLIQAFIPDVKADKVVKIPKKSGSGDYLISGYKPETIEKLLETTTPMALVRFTYNGAPMPYMAFLSAKEDKSPKPKAQAKTVTFKRFD